MQDFAVPRDAPESSRQTGDICLRLRINRIQQNLIIAFVAKRFSRLRKPRNPDSRRGATGRRGGGQLARYKTGQVHVFPTGER